MNYTDDKYRSLFLGVLESLDMKRNVTVAQDRLQASRWSVSAKGENITLTYNPFAITYNSEADLLCDFRHEACHLLTIPYFHFEIPALDSVTQSAICSYLDLFREYLAEKEYCRRFPNDATYRNFRERTFLPDAILKALELKLKTSKMNVQQAMLAYFEAFFVIYYDAVCLYLQGSPEFELWCARNNASAIYQLFRIIMEDMELIAGASTDYTEQLRMVEYSCVSVLRVSLQDMIENQAIYVMGSFPDRENRFPALSQLWSKRAAVYA